MRKPRFLISRCCPRTVAMPQMPPSYGSTGIARYQADIRCLVERSAPDSQITQLREELCCILSQGLTDGSLTPRVVADEAFTAIDHGGTADAAMLVFYRHSLDLCAGSREEIEDADQLIKQEVERLTKDFVRCPARRRIILANKLSLLRACQAKSVCGADRKLDLAREAVNQAYEADRDAWLTYLTVLLLALLLKGEFEMAAALRRYLVTQGVRQVPLEPSLNPKLWRCVGRKTHHKPIERLTYDDSHVASVRDEDRYAGAKDARRRPVGGC